MSDLQVKIIPLVNAKVTKELKVTLKLENVFFFLTAFIVSSTP